MRWMLLLLTIPLCAQTSAYLVEPTTLRQGEAIRVRTPAEVQAVRLDGREFPLFEQPDGVRFGLVPFPATGKPGVYPLEFLAAGGKVVSATRITVQDAKFPTQNITVGKAIQELRPAPGEMEAVAGLRKMVSDTRYWQEPFSLPVRGCMTSPFGVQRLHNGKPTGNYHGGLDQRAATGHPVHATAGGLVRIARMFNIHGGTVGIDHGQGVTSIYLHLSGFAVEEGAEVKAGDLIGYAGSTGRSTAPHLHWTINVHGVPVNPLQWVKVAPCGTAKPAPRSSKPPAARKPATTKTSKSKKK
jgi:murein DD-endopeptidase MepM/ murein hydrolase activator NlpD